jgi:hypothetical protein
MGALSIVPSSLPPARAALIALTRRIADAEKRLDLLVSGKARLQSELAKAVDARAELQSLIKADSDSLLQLMKSGATWALSMFSNARARSLSAQLAESQLEAQVGSSTLAGLDEELQELERQVAELKASKTDLVRAAVREAASTLFEDYDTVVAEMAALMVQLRGLELHLGVERLPLRTVAQVPDFRFTDGLPNQAVAAPKVEVEAAAVVFAAYANALAVDPLAPASLLKCRPVRPAADDGAVIYSEMSEPERRRVDAIAARGN